MKITKRQLRRIIKEEKQKLLKEQSSSIDPGSDLIEFAHAYASLGSMVQQQVETLSHEWMVQGAHIPQWDEAVYEQNPAAIKQAADQLMPFLRVWSIDGQQEAKDLLNMFEDALEIYAKGEAEVEADARAAGDIREAIGENFSQEKRIYNAVIETLELSAELGGGSMPAAELVMSVNHMHKDLRAEDIHSFLDGLIEDGELIFDPRTQELRLAY